MAYIKELKVTFERKRVDDDLLKAPVESSTRVYELFGHLQDETKEKVVVLHLNPQLEILSYEVSAIGTAHRALIDAVEIYRNAMLARASVLGTIGIAGSNRNRGVRSFLLHGIHGIAGSGLSSCIPFRSVLG